VSILSNRYTHYSNIYWAFSIRVRITFLALFLYLINFRATAIKS